MAGVKGRSGRRPNPPIIPMTNGVTILPGEEPPPSGSVPPCPPELEGNEEAKKKWEDLHRIAPWMTRVDVDAIMTYCVTWADWIGARGAITRDGCTYETGAGMVRAHPAVAMARDSLATLMKLQTVLGLNPMDRGRMRIQTNTTKDDELGQFIADGTSKRIEVNE